MKVYVSSTGDCLMDVINMGQHYEKRRRILYVAGKT